MQLTLQSRYKNIEYVNQQIDSAHLKIPLHGFCLTCHLINAATYALVLQLHTFVNQGAPVPGNSMEELPPELAQQGWEKLWSKRENRPYFWNKLTGTSLWEMPVNKSQVC